MIGMMEYKGYHAKIEYSPEDETFVGEVFGIADTLVFDGQSIEELRTMFHETIDDYLETCRELGKQPDKEYCGTFSVTVPAELHREAAIVAESKGIPLDRLVAEALRGYVATT